MEFFFYVATFIAGALCAGLGFIAYMFVMILRMEPRRIDGQ